MHILKIALLSLLSIGFLTSSGQRLRKADRITASNLRSHLAHLQSGKANGGATGPSGETKAEYIRKHFQSYGLKPRGDMGSWFQPFEIYEGKSVQPSTHVTINGEKLTLLKDYFPFSFSASDEAHAAVAIVLAENDVPWFRELTDITEEHQDTTNETITDLIRREAEYAASKGASALFIYNNSGRADLSFDKMDRSAASSIPVIYLKRTASLKYLGDQTATLDVDLKVALEEKKRKSRNIIGYADNGADSTIVAATCLNNDTGVAALIELARLSKTIRSAPANYLFLVYSGEQEGTAGRKYFDAHPSIDPDRINYYFNLDSIIEKEEKRDGLNLVRQSMEIISNNDHQRLRTR